MLQCQHGPQTRILHPDLNRQSPPPANVHPEDRANRITGKHPVNVQDYRRSQDQAGDFDEIIFIESYHKRADKYDKSHGYSRENRQDFIDL